MDAVSARAPVLILTAFLLVALGLGLYHGVVDRDFLSPMPETKPGAPITVP